MLSRHPGLELNDLIVGLQLRKTKNAVDYRFVYPRVVDNRQLYRRTVILAERVHVFGTCTGLNVEAVVQLLNQETFAFRKRKAGRNRLQRSW